MVQWGLFRIEVLGYICGTAFVISVGQHIGREPAGGVACTSFTGWVLALLWCFTCIACLEVTLHRYVHSNAPFLPGFTAQIVKERDPLFLSSPVFLPYGGDSFLGTTSSLLSATMHPHLGSKF